MTTTTLFQWEMPLKNARAEKAIASLAVLVSCLTAAGAVWACTGQTRILSITPQAAMAGTPVNVSGNAVASGTPVQVRWNSLTGPQLGSTEVDEHGSFSLNVTIPEAPPGIYYLVIGAGSEGVGRAAVEVTESPAFSNSGHVAATERQGTSQSPATDLWGSFSNRSGSEPSAPSVQGSQFKGSSSRIVGGAALFLFGTAALFLFGILALKGGIATSAGSRGRKPL